MKYYECHLRAVNVTCFDAMIIIIHDRSVMARACPCDRSLSTQVWYYVIACI